MQMFVQIQQQFRQMRWEEVYVLCFKSRMSKSIYAKSFNLKGRFSMLGRQSALKLDNNSSYNCVNIFMR